MHLAAPRRPSPTTLRLSQNVAETLARAGDQWTIRLSAEVMTAAGLEAAASDPVLRAASERALRSAFLHWATATANDPGARVTPDLGEETVYIMRDLIRRGLEDVVLAAYRAGQTVAFRYMLDTAFAITRDADELEGLLDFITGSISDFVESTIGSVLELMKTERAEVLRGYDPELLDTVALVLRGSPISTQRSESKLGYRLTQDHTAAVVWSTEPGADLAQIAEVVDMLRHERIGRSLVVASGTSTRWLWLPGADDIDREKLRRELDSAGSVKVALGERATGVDGFRRTHLDALDAQRMVAKLNSPHNVVFMDEVRLVSLITENLDSATQYINKALGGLKEAPLELRETVLTYIEESGNIGRSADRMFAHRNTIVRRMERAQALLPRPLAETSVQVAAALQVLHWSSPAK